MDKVEIEKIIRNYLPSVVHLSLATVQNNIPWVCEVHFAYDKELNLYFRSLESRRHSQEIAKNPNVAGNIVRQHELGDKVIGVYFEGKSQKLNPGKDQEKAFQCIKNCLSASDDILEEASREDGHQFYKITVSNWYVFGRFDEDRAQKHKLQWHGGEK